MFVIYKQPSGFMASNGILILNQTHYFIPFAEATNTVRYGRLQGFQ